MEKTFSAAGRWRPAPPRLPPLPVLSTQPRARGTAGSGAGGPAGAARTRPSSAGAARLGPLPETSRAARTRVEQRAHGRAGASPGPTVMRRPAPGSPAPAPATATHRRRRSQRSPRYGVSAGTGRGAGQPQAPRGRGGAAGPRGSAKGGAGDLGAAPSPGAAGSWAGLPQRERRLEFGRRPPAGCVEEVLDGKAAGPSPRLAPLRSAPGRMSSQVPRRAPLSTRDRSDPPCAEAPSPRCPPVPQAHRFSRLCRSRAFLPPPDYMERCLITAGPIRAKSFPAFASA